METNTTKTSIPAHLTSTCEAVCTDAHCPQMVKQATTGRWFITIGHAGFNSATNNGAGYKTKDTAYQAAYTYLCRSGRTITSTLPKTDALKKFEAAQAAKARPTNPGIVNYGDGVVAVEDMTTVVGSTEPRKIYWQGPVEDLVRILAADQAVR